MGEVEALWMGFSTNAQGLLPRVAIRADADVHVLERMGRPRDERVAQLLRQFLFRPCLRLDMSDGIQNEHP